MKKASLLAPLMLLTLTACSQSTSINHQDKPKEPKTEQTQTSKTIDNSKYNDVIKQIKKGIDPDDTGMFTVEVQNNLVDSDFPKGHNVIKVLLVGDAKTEGKKYLDAINSNTATTEQSDIINMFRTTVSDCAKNLPDDTTTIDFGYEIADNQYELIAKSSKVKDYIEIGDLNLN
ncbi:hypothetical protein [Streptococcus agalactiae]|uniref:hypothetical protein n=1 Tax=Streptococcus agalactiae TaxID=1311 RepID=UPI00085BCC82|nr:hypothetical protein [Streptococcus agalactiae]